MKKLRLIALVLSCLTVLPLCFGSCEVSPAETSDTQVTDTQTQTEPVTETEAETEAETEDPHINDFNYGKVKYEKVSTHISISEYPDDKIGKIAAGGDDGVVTLFGSDFSDGDQNCGGKAVSRQENSAGVVDGVMYIPYSETEPSHLSGGWTTWAPDVNVDYKDYKQSQLYADLLGYFDVEKCRLLRKRLHVQDTGQSGRRRLDIIQ